jgi:hypothetical protein
MCQLSSSPYMNFQVFIDKLLRVAFSEIGKVVMGNVDLQNSLFLQIIFFLFSPYPSKHSLEFQEHIRFIKLINETFHFIEAINYLIAYTFAIDIVLSFIDAKVFFSQVIAMLLTLIQFLKSNSKLRFISFCEKFLGY